MEDRKKIVLKILVFFNSLLSVLCDCYSAPGYQATSLNYSCRLHQPHWAPEAYFEITFKHCKEEPTFDVFIRNFFGIDEINMEFSKAITDWTTRKFDGKAGTVSLAISTFDANAKYKYEAHVQAKITIGLDVLLTAVFIANDKSNCSWIEKLALHNQLLFGASLCFGLVLVGMAACCYRKRRNSDKLRIVDRSSSMIALQTIT